MTKYPNRQEPYRVAIYATPHTSSEWWDRGSRWLGRCAARDVNLPMPDIEGVDYSTQTTLTNSPRRYGWHATLKAPFQLRCGESLSTLRDAVATICRDHKPIDLGPLQVSFLKSFLALRPALESTTLTDLAEDCVRRLHALSAPLSDSEIARRQRGTLTPEEQALLLAWGYPWVLNRFRFHFSLSDSLTDASEELVARIQLAATHHFEALSTMKLDHLSIFVEQIPGANFVLLEQVELGI